MFQVTCTNFKSMVIVAAHSMEKVVNAVLPWTALYDDGWNSCVGGGWLHTRRSLGEIIHDICPRRCNSLVVRLHRRVRFSQRATCLIGVVICVSSPQIRIRGWTNNSTHSLTSSDKMIPTHQQPSHKRFSLKCCAGLNFTESFRSRTTEGLRCTLRCVISTTFVCWIVYTKVCLRCARTFLVNSPRVRSSGGALPSCLAAKRITTYRTHTDR